MLVQTNIIIIVKDSDNEINRKSPVAFIQTPDQHILFYFLGPNTLLMFVFAQVFPLLPIMSVVPFKVFWFLSFKDRSQKDKTKSNT